ncbi:L-lactate dehydrogenase (cytochrome) [Sphingopyxis sp. OAS728]|uniref:FMN-dependent L-lactate dehydrogenase LldD n=1 Tax=Sphingopyxis sp. OAS728 TaxID=2663823 RepID=UPI00178A8D1D|nr:FMN-dependent L-lactate dehydrogenase LldD [Sphingopyxis sp. OAS728]MBE1526345.1 L-lactate dehydrogenase (cytochrome) [Sphingopyxis sp. OAS728]
MKPASIGDYREAARRRLPHFLFEYFDGGSYAERTLRANVGDLQDISLRQRVMNNVSAIDLSTSLFGQHLAMPVALGPIGLAGMAARRGEVQAARAAAAKGVSFTLSTVSACSLGEVARGSPTPFWFQLYMVRDRGFMRSLLDEASAAHCPVLVFTVDMPLPGARYRDVRSGLSGAANLRGQARRVGQAMARPGWAWDVGIHGRPHQLGNVAPLLGPKSGLEDFLGWMKDNFDPSVTWADLDFVRAHWNGPIVIKGILDADDARRADEAGVDGIIVSNHGGRQLDGVPSVARALPAIADAVGSRLTILADGGVRSGLDVVRMLALGAQGVLLGRAWAFALAAAGEAGVRHVLDLIEAEMRVAMALTGVTTIDKIGPETLAA